MFQENYLQYIVKISTNNENFMVDFNRPIDLSLKKSKKQL